GRLRRPPGPVHGAADVVDDDPGALPGELERVAATDAAAGAGDDDDTSIADSAHGGDSISPSGAAISKPPPALRATSPCERGTIGGGAPPFGEAPYPLPPDWFQVDVGAGHHAVLGRQRD